MSWFKKIVQIFKGNDDEFQYEEPIEQDDHEANISTNTQSINKDVDVKVMYQYPKGKFRFPMIPDEVSAEPKRQPRNQNDRETKQPLVKHHYRNQKPKQQEAPIVSPHKTKSGPFRATEIPSPIFGFDRPKDGKLVEYELTAFSKTKSEHSKTTNPENTSINQSEIANKIERDQHQSEDNHYIINTTKPNLEEKSQVFDSHSVNPLVDVNSLKLEVEQGSVNDGQVEEVVDLNEVENVEEERFCDPFEVEQSVAVESFSKLEEVNLMDKEESVGKPENTESSNKERSADLIEEKMAEEFEDVDVSKLEKVDEKESVALDENEVINIEEPAFLNEQIEGAHSIDSVEIEKVNNDISDMDQDESFELDESLDQNDGSIEANELTQFISAETEIAVTQSLEAIEPFVHDTAQDTIEKQNISWEEELEHLNQEEGVQDVNRIEEVEIDLAQQEEPIQPIRKHIPFNVLMLKDDKRKWEARQAFQKPEALQPVIEEQPVQMIEESSVELNQKTKEQTDIVEHYCFPSIDLMKPPVFLEPNEQWLEDQKELLNTTLKNFNVGAEVVNITQGPSVTQFEVHPDAGVKVTKITNLTDDIKLGLAAKDVRIEAPIPGTSLIGIEVPNESSRPVFLREIIDSPEFRDHPSPLTVALGLDISGKPIVTDLMKMPHGLIAGATGSGKSVCINSMLVSLLYKAKPNDLKLLLIDPKMVELAPYNHIPHLVSPVITDVKAATAALKWAVEEMERRYELFAHTGVRNISRFNELAEANKQYANKLPYIVIVIDELADLMMMSPADVEEAICRIAQKARACGIHLIIATQRPSVDVITGLIKANVPTRIAFSVSSQIDSRTIIDIAGAEKLLGKGDMLFLENGTSKPVRLQGTYVSDEEIDQVVDHVKNEMPPNYLFEQAELLKKAQISDSEDELFLEACEFFIEQGTASTSSLQRRFNIGYNRAARLIDMLEERGMISEARGSKPRDVLITSAELETLQESSTNL